MSLAALLGTLTACSVGTGAPDGWRYLRVDPLAVAVPKTWQPAPTGAVLRGAGGRTNGEVTVSTDAAPHPATGPGGPAAAPGAPQAPAAPGAPRPPAAPGRHRSPATPDKAAAALAAVHRESLVFDGRPGQVLSYAQAAPDGRPAARVEVRLRDDKGRPVTVRAWTADGATNPRVLREIINSIEFAGRPDR
jgi:hypothetical protein